MKARGRPLTVCPFVAVISSDPSRCFQTGCQRLLNRAALTVQERVFERAALAPQVGTPTFRHFWSKCAGLKANSHPLMLHQFTYDTNKNQIGERSQVRSGYWTHAALTNSLCFMNECTGSDKELPSACTKKSLSFFFLFLFSFRDGAKVSNF